MFSISYGDLETNKKVLTGEIVVGHFRERFSSNISYWRRKDYESQWKEALKRILSFENSSLITDIYDPAKANYLTWWPMYRINNEVVFQNHVLFLKDLKSKFDLKNPYKNIPEYVSVNEEGEKISEWKIPLKEIESFLRT